MKKLLILFLIAPFLWVSCPSGDNNSTNGGGGTGSGGVTISLAKTALTLTIGKTERLTADVTSADNNKAVTWTTSNAGIAGVSANGTVTAVAVGNATITAASKADSTKTAQCAVTVNPRPSSAIGGKEEVSDISAAAYFEAKNVYIGWNLGNAFDAGSGYGSWTRKINRDFLPKVKAAGFSMVRIPVTWDINSRPIGAAPNYTLNATTLNELAEVVDWAYEAGLVTIINIHHDDKNWLDMKELIKGEAQRNAAYAKFTKVWEQIADKFKNYGEWLIFEPFNELHDGGWGWNPSGGDLQFTIINTLNQTFTDTVRASGGNNAKRYLVVQPLCAKPHQTLDSRFVLPTDATTTNNKQIVSMHYYEPEGFALNGTTTAWSTSGAGSRTDITAKFQSYANKYKTQGIPIILGESGATYQKRDNAAERETAAAQRLLYMEHMCSTAKANGIVPVYWDNGTIWASGVGENFGLWDRRSTGDLNVIPGMQPVINAMINAVN